MDFSSVANVDKRKAADVLVLPLWQVKDGAECAVKCGALKSHVTGPVSAGDFKGKEGEVVFVYPSQNKESRIALLGLGKEKDLSSETLRRSFASLVKSCQKKEDVTSLNVFLPDTKYLSKEAVSRGVSEGLYLANYSYDKLKKDSLKNGGKTVTLKKVAFIGADRALMLKMNKIGLLCESVHFARDLVNGNADEVNPQYLASLAKDLGKKLPKVKTTVFDKKRIEKEGMGLLLAVNRGSRNDPAFIIMEYKGAPKSKDCTVLVGKGVTYDTGGLNLKPTGSMETMKCDMAGSAVAFGTIYAAASMGLNVNLTAVVAATENCIDAKSYKPGDVYSSYSGKTIEIGNTDAEGRLTLADALAYAEKNLSPTRMIDFATLTGAIVIALGEETIGMMSNDEGLSGAFSKAGEETYERVCRLPLYKEYRDQLKSDIADISNLGGRPAGSITAGLFLQEFVGKTPWVHFDIAGTAYLSKARRYNPKNGTGSGVRLMVEYLQNLTVKGKK
ncbi:MAG: leucyl aminopeptidase [Chlamydiales bacterium]|jgi:leucyl aminopeptidase